jgi:hypothetical protein
LSPDEIDNIKILVLRHIKFQVEDKTASEFESKEYDFLESFENNDKTYALVIADFFPIVRTNTFFELVENRYNYLYSLFQDGVPMHSKNNSITKLQKQNSKYRDGNIPMNFLDVLESEQLQEHLQTHLATGIIYFKALQKKYPTDWWKTIDNYVFISETDETLFQTQFDEEMEKLNILQQLTRLKFLEIFKIDSFPEDKKNEQIKTYYPEPKHADSYDLKDPDKFVINDYEESDEEEADEGEEDDEYEEAEEAEEGEEYEEAEQYTDYKETEREKQKKQEEEKEKDITTLTPRRKPKAS